MITRFGWCAVGTALVLFAMAALLAIPALAVLAAGCAAMVGVGVAWVRQRPPLEVERSVEPRRLTVGDPATAQLTIRNPTTRLSLPLEARDRVGSAHLDLPIPRLAPGESRTTHYSLPTQRRAVVEVGPLEIVRTDPFGIARVQQGRGTSEVMFVHPRRHAVRPLPAAFERSLDGVTTDSSPRGTHAFHQLREYVPGDDRRMIHWRSSARTGTLIVRQHVDTSQPDLTVLLDNRDEKIEPGTFEEMVEIAASLICSCTDLGYPCRLRTTDGAVFEAPLGQSASTYFLDRLAGVELKPIGDLAGLTKVTMSSSEGYGLVIVTAQPTEHEVAALSTLVRRFTSVYLVDAQPEVQGRHSIPGVVRIDATSARSFAEQWNQGLGR